jgi:hypothetical protein
MQLNPRPIVPNRSSRTIALFFVGLAALTTGCVSGGQSGDLNGNALSEPDASTQKHRAAEDDAGTETASERTAQPSSDSASSDSASSDETSDAAANTESNFDGSSECDESCRQSLFSQLCHKKSALPCAGRDLEECMDEAADDYAQSSAVSEECVAGYLRATRCYAAGDWRCDELGREAGNERCSATEQAALENCQRDAL